jgi:GABA(A) receptor-associated protein
MPIFGKSTGPEEPSFAQQPLEKRKKEADKILEKYPHRIPCIVERAESSKNSIALIDKTKYLVPDDMTFGQFIFTVRKRLKLEKEQAIFLYVNNLLPPTTMTMSQVYEEHKDESNFLMITYAAESSYGL